jgi:PAS domain S-box-containing protein
MDDLPRGPTRSRAEDQASRGPRPGLRAHLVALVLAVLLPSLLLGGATALHMVQNYRQVFEDRLSDTARALALALDADIGAHMAALRALAASPDLDPGGDLAEFRKLAERAMAGFGSWVVVSTPDRRAQLLNTSLPPDAPLPSAREPPPAPMVERAIATGEPGVVNLHVGPAMGRPTTAVVVPVVRAGRVVSLLGAPVLPERLSGILMAQGVPDTGFATLSDGLNRIVARSAEHERHVGGSLPAWFPGASAGRERGIAQGPALDGREARIAFQRLASAPSWTLSVGASLDSYRTNWLMPLLGLAAGGAVTFALALAMAAWLARRILRPVRALVRRADALPAGEAADPPDPLPAAAVAEFDALRLAVERADMARRKATAELRESEARFRGVFDSDLLALCIFDATLGRPLAVNDRTLRLMDTTREEFESGARDWGKATAPEHLARVLDLGHPIPGTGRGEPIEKDFIRRDGRRVPVRLRVAPLPGQPGRVVVAAEDLSETRAAEQALRESEARFRALTGLVPNFIWFATPDGALRYMNDRWYEYTGQVPADALTHGWTAALHPDDAARTAAIWDEARRTETMYEIEMRYRRHDGEYRWHIARAEPVRDEAGRVTAWFGSSTDIHDRKLTEERQVLLMRELDHRAKNTLAVVQAALRLTPKEDAAAYARAVEGRVTALARAHAMLAAARWEGAELRALLASELAAFPAGQVGDLSGPRVILPAAAAQSVAMAVHELATNAAKHGALSIPTGRVAVAWRMEGGAGAAPLLVLTWTETGGPPVAGAPSRRGFGSRVLDATIRTQLAGRVTLAWEAAGLACTIEVPLRAPGREAAWAPGVDLALPGSG